MKKRILLCLGGYKPELAGGAKSHEQIIKSLNQKINFNIISFSKKYDDNFSFKIKKIYRIKSYKNILILKSLLKLISYFISIRHSFDLLHLRGHTQKNIILIILAKIFNKKIIFTPTRYKEDDINTIRNKSFFQYFFLKKIDLVHCIAPIFFTLKNNFVKKKFKFKYLPNLVDTNYFKLTKKKNKVLNILCVGFFSEIKNQKLLYDAWLNISKKYNCTLTFVGKKKFNYYLSSDHYFEKIYIDAKKKKY